MRRWRRGVWGVVDGAGHLPRIKIIFCPQNNKLGCIFRQFLRGRKHGSLGTWVLQFHREITKLTKQCKNYPKIDGQGAVAPLLPEYATGLVAEEARHSKCEKKA